MFDSRTTRPYWSYCLRIRASKFAPQVTAGNKPWATSLRPVSGSCIAEVNQPVISATVSFGVLAGTNSICGRLAGQTLANVKAAGLARAASWQGTFPSHDFPQQFCNQTPQLGSAMTGNRLEVEGGRHRIPAPARPPLADRLRQSERRPECWCDRSSRTHKSHATDWRGFCSAQRSRSALAWHNQDRAEAVESWQAYRLSLCR